MRPFHKLTVTTAMLQRIKLVHEEARYVIRSIIFLCEGTYTDSLKPLRHLARVTSGSVTARLFKHA